MIVCFWREGWLILILAQYIPILRMKNLKKYIIFYLDSSVVFFLRLPLNNGDKVRSLMLNPTINLKTLDMLENPTLRNQSKTHLNCWKNIGSCIVGYDIGCRIVTSISWFPLRDHRRSGVASLLGVPQTTHPLVDNDHKLVVCQWNRQLR